MPADQVKIDLDSDAVEELLGLCEHAANLTRYVAAAGEAGAHLGVSALARRIADKVGSPVSDVRSALSTVLNIYHTQVRLKVDTKQTVQALTDALDRFAKSDQDVKASVDAWKKTEPAIVEATRLIHPDHPLEAAFKAFRVASARQYEATKIKIFTDVRPVFNAAGDAIVQTVVTHVLSLEYHDGPDHRIIQCTLDAKDLSELKEECERATRKGDVVKHEFRMMPWPTSILRELPSAEGQP